MIFIAFGVNDIKTQEKASYFFLWQKDRGRSFREGRGPVISFLGNCYDVSFWGYLDHFKEITAKFFFVFILVCPTADKAAEFITIKER